MPLGQSSSEPLDRNRYAHCANATAQPLVRPHRVVGGRQIRLCSGTDAVNARYRAVCIPLRVSPPWMSTIPPVATPVPPSEGRFPVTGPVPVPLQLEGRVIKETLVPCLSPKVCLATSSTHGGRGLFAKAAIAKVGRLMPSLSQQPVAMGSTHAHRWTAVPQQAWSCLVALTCDDKRTACHPTRVPVKTPPALRRCVHDWRTGVRWKHAC